MDGHRAKLRNLVEVASGIAQTQYDAAKAGRRTEDQAKENTRDIPRSLRYSGQEYFFAYQFDGTNLVLPTNRKIEGTKELMDKKDADGVLFVRALIDVAKNGGGFVAYRFPKIGNDTPFPKLSHAVAFQPWGWMIGTGIYVDDVEAAYRQRAGELIAGVVVVGFVLAFVVHLIARGVTREMGGFAGLMARALSVFRRRSMENARLPNERERDKRIATERGLLSKLGDEVRERVQGVVDRVAARAADLDGVSRELTAAADATRGRAADVAGVTRQTSADVETIASAAEELSMSSGEIGRQVARSADVAREAMNEAERTTDAARTLTEATKRVGEVVGLIQSVAGQTNPPALNATIEAARAGEAGEGFAAARSLSEDAADLEAQLARFVGELRDAAARIA